MCLLLAIVSLFSSSVVFAKSCVSLPHLAVGTAWLNLFSPSLGRIMNAVGTAWLNLFSPSLGRIIVGTSFHSPLALAVLMVGMCRYKCCSTTTTAPGKYLTRAQTGEVIFGGETMRFCPRQPKLICSWQCCPECLDTRFR